MLIRVFNCLTFLSAFGLLSVVLMMAAAGFFSPFGPPVLSLSRDCHIKVDGADLTGQIHFYNQATAGPYRGGIVGFAGDPNGPETTGFNFPGVYYRDIRWPDGRRFWTLSLHLLPIAMLLSILPSIWVVRNRRRMLPARLLRHHPE